MVKPVRPIFSASRSWTFPFGPMASNWRPRAFVFSDGTDDRLGHVRQMIGSGGDRSCDRRDRGCTPSLTGLIVKAGERDTAFRVSNRNVASPS